MRWRRTLLFVLVVILVVDCAASAIITALRVNDLGLQAVRTQQPAPQWAVVRRSFTPWAGDVRVGSMRFDGAAGPRWMLELSAPGDSKWRHYSAVVLVDALSGRVEAAQSVGSND